MESNSTIAKLVSELAKETVKESDAIGVNSLNELKHIHAQSTKLVEAEISMKKLVAKNADDSNKKLDNLNASCLASATAIKSLILSTQNQTRLNAIQMLIMAVERKTGNHGYIVLPLEIFPTYSVYGYSSHSELCSDLIKIFKLFNKDNGFYVASLQSTKNDSTCHNYIVDCIHELTGMKPIIAAHTDGKFAIWRE